MEQRGEVVMAVYRPDPDLVRRQIESIRDQTLTSWNCRIGIDGADPETRDLLGELIGDDPRFAVVEHDENVGVYRHFERLLGDVAPDASWVALSDQDDHWDPDKLAQLTAALSGPVSAVSCQARVVDRDGRVLSHTDRLSASLSDLLLRNQMTGSLSLWRRDVLDLALPFPDATEIAIHDHWLAVCAAAVGDVVVLDRALQDYVQHGANVIGEAGPTRVRDELHRAADHGGVRGHLDHAAEQRWQWRVGMAGALLDRGHTGDALPLLTDVAAGRVTSRVVGAVGRSVWRRRLRVRGAVGTLAAAGWAQWQGRAR